MKRMQRVFGDLDALRFVDGRLDEERKAAFLAHLAEDAAEAERVAVWSRQNEAIRAAFAGVVEEPVPPALRLGNLPSRRPAPSVGESPRPPIALRAIPLRPAETRQGGLAPGGVDYLARPQAAAMPRPLDRLMRLPVGAALLLGLAMLIVYITHGLLNGSAGWPDGAAAPQSPPATLTSRAAAAFATYGLDPIRPVEFSAAQGSQLATWIKRRVGASIEPADLSREGWTLLGGRLVPALDTPAAFFVYEGRSGDRLGLMVSRTTSAPSTAVSLDAAPPDLAAMSWGSGSFAYVITVDKTVDWLSRNGEALKEQIAWSRAGE